MKFLSLHKPLVDLYGDPMIDEKEEPWTVGKVVMRLLSVYMAADPEQAIQIVSVGQKIMSVLKFDTQALPAGTSIPRTAMEDAEVALIQNAVRFNGPKLTAVVIAAVAQTIQEGSLPLVPEVASLQG